MPFYDYHCRLCDHELEIKQPINSRAKRKCPECGKLQLERLISRTFAHGEPTTLGGVAEKNAAKMGRYEREKKQAELDNAKKRASDNAIKDLPGVKKRSTGQEHKPWYGKAPDNIIKEASTAEVGKISSVKELPPKVEKYIMTGES